MRNDLINDAVYVRARAAKGAGRAARVVDFEKVSHPRDQREPALKDQLMDGAERNAAFLRESKQSVRLLRRRCERFLYDHVSTLFERLLGKGAM